MLPDELLDILNDPLELTDTVPVLLELGELDKLVVDVPDLEEVVDRLEVALLVMLLVAVDDREVVIVEIILALTLVEPDELLVI